MKNNIILNTNNYNNCKNNTIIPVITYTDPDTYKSFICKENVNKSGVSR